MKDESKKLKMTFPWALDENKYLGLDQVKKLLSSCKKFRDKALKKKKRVAVRDWFMIELGLNTGLRVNEMVDLECGDLLINENHSSVVVRRGKGRKKRSVLINSQFKNTCFWFLAWKEKAGEGTMKEAPLLTVKGKRLAKRTLQKAFKRCAQRPGLEKHYSIHCLRHTYGSHLYVASNHNLRLVQHQLGHSSVRVTEVYANLINNDVKEAIENIYKK